MIFSNICTLTVSYFLSDQKLLFRSLLNGEGDQGPLPAPGDPGLYDDARV